MISEKVFEKQFSEYIQRRPSEIMVAHFVTCAYFLVVMCKSKRIPEPLYI
jgi:hypothetical protein